MRQLQGRACYHHLLKVGLSLSAAVPGLSGLPLNRINTFLSAGRRILQGRRSSFRADNYKSYLCFVVITCAIYFETAGEL